MSIGAMSQLYQMIACIPAKAKDSIFFTTNEHE